MRGISVIFGIAFVGCHGNTTKSKLAGDSDLCFGPNIETVEASFDYRNPDEGSFSLKYESLPSEPAQNDRFVIILPGGPGQQIIGTEVNPELARYSLGAVPKAFNRVYVDPRGIGCNAFAAEQPYRFYSTATLANDVLGIIKKLARDHQDLDYVIYGASFGSAHATVLASLIQRESSIPRPTAVVLEGTLGHAFESFAAYFSEFDREWQRVFATLPGHWQNLFVNNRLPTFFTPRRQHVNSKVWGQYIAGDLIMGHMPGVGHLINWHLTDPTGHQILTSRLSKLADASQSGTLLGSSRLFTSIACQELWGGFRLGREMKDGGIIAYGDNVCDGAGLGFDNKYESSNWQIGVPIYYMQGQFDPTTTVSQAEYHFLSQRVEEKTFLKVCNASHAPMTIGLRAKECASPIWQAIFENSQSQIDSAVASCRYAEDSEVVVTRPGEDFAPCPEQ